MNIKNNIYKLIIFLTLLTILCTYSVIKINEGLFSLSEDPYYTNLFNINDTTLSIRISDSWKRENTEEIISLINSKTGEELKIDYEEKYNNVQNFDTVKALFKLEFESEYNNQVQYKEVEISNNNEIYALIFTLNGRYNIVGIEAVNNKFLNFFYSVASSSENTSELTKILDSIKVKDKPKGVDVYFETQ